MRNAGKARPVIGLLGDGAGDMTTVPGTRCRPVRRRAERDAVVLLLPVTKVPAAWNATVLGPTRHARVADHVVTRDHVVLQVQRPLHDAGVEHRHHDALAGGDLPGLLGANATCGIVEVPLVLRVVRVVRRRGRAHRAHVPVQQVGFRRDHGRVGRQFAQEGRRLRRAQRPRGGDHVPAGRRGATQHLRGHRGACACVRGGLQRTVEPGAAQCVLQRRRLRARGGIAVLDHIAVTGGGHGGRGRGLAHAGAGNAVGRGHAHANAADEDRRGDRHADLALLHLVPASLELGAARVRSVVAPPRTALEIPALSGGRPAGRPPRVHHQPKPAPIPTDFSSPLKAPPTVTVARSLIARW